MAALEKFSRQVDMRQRNAIACRQNPVTKTSTKFVNQYTLDRMVRKRIVVAVLVIGALIVAEAVAIRSFNWQASWEGLKFLAWIVTTPRPTPPPTDEYLLWRFENEQHNFERLREMLCIRDAARTIMMDPEWSEPEASASEHSAFYELFRPIGAQGVYYDGQCSFRILVWSVGLAGGGDYKEYVYRPGARYRDVTLSANLDSVNRSGEKVAFYKRHIKGDWFLVFEHWP